MVAAERARSWIAEAMDSIVNDGVVEGVASSGATVSGGCSDGQCSEGGQRLDCGGRS